MTIDNRLVVDIKTTISKATDDKTKCLIKVSGLNGTNIPNKQIGAIAGNPDGPIRKSSFIIDNKDIDEVIRVKNEIYRSCKGIKSKYLESIVSALYKNDANKSWDDLKDYVHKQGMMVSNMTLKIKVTMQHIVPKQESYNGYIMKRYNERAKYYSSIAQVAEINVPLRNVEDIQVITDVVYKLLSHATGVTIEEGNTRESIADYTKSVSDSLAEEYLQNKRNRSNIKDSDEFNSTQEFAGLTWDESKLLDEQPQSTAAIKFGAD